MPAPSLKFLKTFHVAAKRQSFKAAADELCITASAVSHQIKTLEGQLGLLLFERRAHSLALTEAGSHYLEGIDSLFSRFETVTKQLCERYGRETVRLQVPPFFASELLLPHLNCFSQVHPEIDLQIGTHIDPRATHAADADVSVVIGAGPWPDMQAVPLFPQSFIPACAPSLFAQFDIREPADFATQTLIVQNRRLTLWDQWAALHGVAGMKPRQLIRLDSMASAVRAAEAGVGIALVSTPLIADRFAAGTLREVLKAEVPTGESYYLLMRNADTGRAAVCTLMKWLAQKFGRSAEAKNYLV